MKAYITRNKGKGHSSRVCLWDTKPKAIKTGPRVIWRDPIGRSPLALIYSRAAGSLAKAFGLAPGECAPIEIKKAGK